MPVDLSAWDLSRMLVTFLLGVLVATVVFGVPLIRARQRNARLRRQVARLTTATALFVTPEHSGEPREGDARNEPDEQGPATFAAPEPYRPQEPSSPPPMPQPRQQGLEKEAKVPMPPSEHDVPHAPPARAEHHDRVHGVSGIEAPTEPVPVENQPTAGTNGHNDGPRSGHRADSGGNEDDELTSFATEEAADRFRHEYGEPMAEARERIARLRAQLHDVPAATTTNGHGNPGSTS